MKLHILFHFSPFFHFFVILMQSLFNQPGRVHHKRHYAISPDISKSIRFMFYFTEVVVLFKLRKYIYIFEGVNLGDESCLCSPTVEVSVTEIKCVSGHSGCQCNVMWLQWPTTVNAARSCVPHAQIHTHKRDSQSDHRYHN